mmetsp:Transcript_142263/g.258529  ORF Transcript_142263/g.258529 Transcript_142263/m.258529 type:complete len:523 (-) Transcript_142263:28-1596(-)
MLSIMHKITVALACLASASHGRRTQISSEQLTRRRGATEGTLQPFAAAALLLQSSTPADAFNPTHAGAHSYAGNTRFAAPRVGRLPRVSMSDDKAEAPSSETQDAMGEDKASASKEQDSTEELLKMISELKSQIDDKDKVIEEKDKIIESMKAPAEDGVSHEMSTSILPDMSTMVKDEGLGITGRWKEAAGNFVLYPKDIESNPPKGLIHFLGGAFVGAAPHYTYRFLLDSLCNEGYIVVTTPYKLKFDYLQICDDILSKFGSVHTELTEKFGSMPVIGVGHSCGALLHTYIASLFPDTPRDGNVLISWNNKPVTEAIPGFDEMVVPISKQVMGTDTTSDPAAGAREALANLRSAVDVALDGVKTLDTAPSIVKDEVVPVVKQGLELVDQIPDLFASIAAGTREFNPTPEETRTTARSNYRANRTLLIQFESDEIDETPEIQSVLHEAAKLSEAGMQIDLKVIGGTHVTPLTQNVILEPPPLEFDGQAVPDPLTGVREQVRENFLSTINEVKTEISDWLSRA